MPRTGIGALRILVLDMIPFLFLLGAFLVSLVSAAFFSVDPIGLEVMTNRGNRRASRCLQLRQYLEDMLIGFLIISDTLLIFYGITASLLVLSYFSEKHPPTISTFWGFLIVALAVVIGDILPKSIAVRFSTPICLIFVDVMQLFLIVLLPVTRSIVAGMRWVFRLPKKADLSYGDAAFRALLGLSTRKGSLKEEERKMIEGLIDFQEAQAKDVMVPRVDMVALPASAPLSKVADVMVKSGHSRIPVYEESPDSISGIIYAKDVLKKMWENESWEQIPASLCLRPAYFVHESKKISEIFSEMRTQNIQMAIVLDEFGGTAGLLTSEDLLEEIVGEIRDEYDLAEAPEVKWMNPERTEGLFSARLILEDLNQYLDLHLKPTEDFETIGGLIYTQLGRMPRKGDSIEYEGAKFVVEEVRRNRILLVRIRVLTPQK